MTSGGEDRVRRLRLLARLRESSNASMGRGSSKQPCPSQSSITSFSLALANVLTDSSYFFVSS